MFLGLGVSEQWILSGAGNVLKEISEPAGALIKASRFDLGDPTLNLLEIWGAEYQESNAVLVRSQDKAKLLKLGQREKCPVNFVGHITDTGKVWPIQCVSVHHKKFRQNVFPSDDWIFTFMFQIQFEDDLKTLSEVDEPELKKAKTSVKYPVDLELEHVLGSMPRKVNKSRSSRH